jgi:AraC-like DNA-binding protein
MIRFGPWSTTLGLAAGFGVAVALLLLAASGNRTANRWLAALMLVVVLRLMPYVIGFAGFYDAWPWLSFAPFDLSLLLGPLLWLHVRALTGSPPARVWPHLLPGAAQFLYLAVAFAQPLATKNAWDSAWHVPVIDPALTALTFVSLGGYIAASLRHRTLYLGWLADHVSDRDEHRQPWLGALLVALALLTAIAAAFQATDWFITDLDYFDRYPEYLGYSAILLWIGLEGWRRAGHRFPPMRVDSPVASPAPARDWQALGRDWAARIEAGRWWAEPQLTAAEVARRLATNQNYLSRALNAGLGQNFNECINRMRVAAVRAALAGGARDDLLSLALDAGFSSKASFNRAFRAYTGQTPQAFRVSNPESVQVSGI